MSNDLRMNSVTGGVILCCGSKRCPEVMLVDGHICITDDHGGEIKITKEQASLIDDAVGILTDQTQTSEDE